MALINASSRATYAQAALKEVLSAMNAKVLTDAEVTIDLPDRNMGAAAIAERPELALPLKRSLAKVLRTINRTG